MRLKKKFTPLIIPTVLLSISIPLWIIFIDPGQYLYLYGFSVNPIIIVFLLIFFWVFCLCSLILFNTRRGGIIAAVAVAMMLLRYLGYNNPLYYFIIVSIGIVLELLFKQLFHSLRRKTSSSVH